MRVQQFVCLVAVRFAKELIVKLLDFGTAREVSEDGEKSLSTGIWISSKTD